MFSLLGQFVFRRRWWVIATAVIFVAISGLWGTGVFGSLSGGGFGTPGSDSERASATLDAALGRADADVIVLYASENATVEDEEFRLAVTGTLDGLPPDVLVGYQTYWSTGSPSFVSQDRRSTYAVLQLSGADEDARTAQFESIEPQLDAPGLTERTGGLAPVARDINEQVSADIGRAEGLSLPIVFILLVIMLGGLAAASLPLIVGGIAIMGSFTAMRLITLMTDVSVFAINIVTLLGLGLAIDYGLFMVNRFREELRRGHEVPQALSRTMATAGRTVAVSGVTVAIALCGLLLFPQVFLRSMGFGGVAAVLVAMIGALTVMPATLAVLGHRVDAFSVRPVISRLAPWTARPRDAEHPGVWHRIAHSVMRRPILYVVGIATVLLVLGSPFLRVSFGGIDHRALPVGTASRVIAETIESDFGGTVSVPAEVAVVFTEPADDPESQASLTTYVQQVQAVPGVTGAEVTGVSGNTARVQVSFAGDLLSAESRGIVEAIRSVPPPPNASVLVGGPTAELVDLLNSLAATLPWMALIVVLATSVLLFLAFGSVVLPVKAIVMNILSLGATFGALVWIFQDGHLASQLGFTPTGTLQATQPILMLAIAFGLSMDYEVFLLSRIREHYDLTGDNAEAVATGLQRTGGIITSAALLLVIVIGAFSTSGIAFIKLIGVGMVIAILVDATIVRVILVPATMRLMGDANWWAPGPLRNVYRRYGFRESDSVPSVTAPTAQGGRHRAMRKRHVGAHRLQFSRNASAAGHQEVHYTRPGTSERVERTLDLTVRPTVPRERPADELVAAGAVGHEVGARQ